MDSCRDMSCCVADDVDELEFNNIVIEYVNDADEIEFHHFEIINDDDDDIIEYNDVEIIKPQTYTMKEFTEKFGIIRIICDYCGDELIRIDSENMSCCNCY
jgi:exosome complex RNA-binding protein Csl4